MDQNMLEKEVLCIIDTRSIQKFVFHANSIEESIGAEVILQDFLYKSIQYAAEHIIPPLAPDEYVFYEPKDKSDTSCFSDPRVRLQVLDNSASNMVMWFCSGRLCRDVLHKMARFHLDNGYSLEFTPACTEWTNDISADIAAVYSKLAENKSDFPGAHPMRPLSIVRSEKNTGEAVAFIDKETGAEYSRISMLRRLGFANSVRVQKSTQIRMRKWRNGRKFYAVAHIDGNNIGAMLMDLVNNVPEGLDPFYVRRATSKKIPKIIDHAFAAAIEDVKNRFGFSDAQMKTEVSIVQFGGDDLNLLADPLVVLPFVERYLAHLSDICLWNDGQRDVFISACAGIAIAGESIDYIKTFDYAEECCSRAKDAAKSDRNQQNGHAGNWLDYTILYPDMADDSEADRELVYTASDGTYLMTRPYCIDPACLHRF